MAKKTNDEWTNSDTVAIFLIGFFWVIGVLIVLTSGHLSSVKKKRLIGYGSLVAVPITFISILLTVY